MVFKTAKSNKISVWGCLRAKTSGTETAELQVKSGSDWVKVKSIPVSASSGYFMQDVVVTGANAKTFRISWSGGESRSSKPGALVSARTN
jgi:hypothetical protein